MQAFLLERLLQDNRQYAKIALIGALVFFKRSYEGDFT